MKVELLEIVFADGTVQRLSLSNVIMDLGGIKYYPGTVSRKNIERDMADSRQGLSFSMALASAHPNLLAWLGDAAGGDPVVTLYSYDMGTLVREELFTGYMVECEGTEKSIEVKVETPMARREKGIPQRIITAGCTLDLYSTRCGLTAELYQCTATIVNQDAVDPYKYYIQDVVKGTSVPASPDSDFFKWGKAICGSEARAMTAVVIGSHIVVTMPFSRKIGAGTAVRFFAGCDKSKETCNLRFVNYPNFMGFPYAPYEEISYVGFKSKGMSGGKKS